MSDHEPRSFPFPLLTPPEREGAACTAGTCACGAGQGDDSPSGDGAAEHGDTPTSPAGEVGASPERTLPTARMTEFDALFSAALREVARPEPTVLHLVLDAGHETAARELAARESGCCSFFTFAFTRHPDGLHWRITVPNAQATVLDALAQRAAAVLEAPR